jgi:DNA-directed RNA polymerase subunit RPC12/RpoP
VKEIEIDVCCPDCSSHEVVFFHAVVTGSGSLRHLDPEPLWEPDHDSEAWCPHCGHRGKLYDFLLDEPLRGAVHTFWTD